MNNTKVSFKKRQIEFLLRNIKNDLLRKKISQEIEEGNIYNNQYVLNFSNNETEIMLNELSYLLTSIGLKRNSEVNEEGLIIEDIIDLFT